MRMLIALLIMTQTVWAEGERAGNFDYYVLSLSWSPGWCASEGDARSSPQCQPARRFGWVLHGLWPQYDRGWPSYCRTDKADPSRTETAAMADNFGTSGAAWHQWKKHGRCSGLSSADYFDRARQAYGAVNRPAAFRKLDQPVRLPASVVKQAFLEANPDWSPDMLTVTCKDQRIAEIRVCLTKQLVVRQCGQEILRDCRSENALLHSIK